MSLPTIAIVGRPNVGKSSLFNAIVGRRTSIVEPTPGVTRDRVSAITDIDDVYFQLVDTGGYGIEDTDDLTDHVEKQIFYAIREAALILFVVDIRDGIVPLDQKVAQLLRREQDRVQLVANKMDEPKMEHMGAEFIRLGYGEPICTSAAHGYGKTELFELIINKIATPDNVAPADPVMKIAFVGKRNTGKSTFVNALAGEDRVIVSEVAGTTRDSIDVEFEKDGRRFIAIDTAGVKKRTKFADSIEFYAYQRAQQSIDRADVALFLIDAAEPVSAVDKKLGKFLVDSYKPVVIVINKWDKAKGLAMTGDYGEYLNKTLKGLDFAPIVFCSAIDGHNVYAAIDVASALFKQSRQRVSTGKLNQALRSALDAHRPAIKRGFKPPRVYFATQVAVAPPTIILFVNHIPSIRSEFMRFIMNQFREMLPIGEVPIKLAMRERRESDVDPSRSHRPRRQSGKR